MNKAIFNMETTWEDIKEFVDMKLHNPLTIKDTLVYNFNPNKVDINKLYRYVETHPDETVLVIPHSMSSAWGIMLQYIPNDLLQRAVFLNYRKKHYVPIYSPQYSNYIFKKEKEEENVQ